jgi:hypothetical protein
MVSSLRLPACLPIIPYLRMAGELEPTEGTVNRKQGLVLGRYRPRDRSSIRAGIMESG